MLLLLDLLTNFLNPILLCSCLELTLEDETLFPSWSLGMLLLWQSPLCWLLRATSSMIWHPVDSLYGLCGLLLFSSIHQAVFVPIFNTIHALRVWKVAIRAWGLMCSLWSCGIWSRTKAWQCLLMEAWLLPLPSHLQPAWWPLPAMTSVSSFGNKTSNTDSQVRFCMF